MVEPHEPQRHNQKNEVIPGGSTVMVFGIRFSIRLADSPVRDLGTGKGKAESNQPLKLIIAS